MRKRILRARWDGKHEESHTLSFVEFEHSFDPPFNGSFGLFVTIEPLVEKSGSFTRFTLYLLDQGRKSRHFHKILVLETREVRSVGEKERQVMGLKNEETEIKNTRLRTRVISD